MVVTRRKKGESKDSLFRRSTRAFIDEDMIREGRERLFYKKPSQVRKEVEIERIKNKGKRRRVSRIAPPRQTRSK